MIPPILVTMILPYLHVHFLGEPLEKKKLLKLILSAAYVRGLRLSAVQPNLQFYPLLALGLGPGF